MDLAGLEIKVLAGLCSLSLPFLEAALPAFLGWWPFPPSSQHVTLTPASVSTSFSDAGPPASFSYGPV